MSICLQEGCTCCHHRLVECIRKGENDEAKSILQNIENFCDMADTSGTTLLHYSAKSGNAALVQYLIDEGCKINARDCSDVTPLIMAITSGNVATVEVLIKNNADMYITAHKNLHCAMNSLQLAVYLRFRLTSMDQPYPTPVLGLLYDKMYKDSMGDRHTMMQLLRNTQYDVKLGAVVFGNVQLASFILKHSYMIDYGMPESGYTALHYAVIFAKTESIRILIAHGADVNVKDLNGLTPIDYYTDRLQNFDEESKILEILLKRTLDNVSSSNRTKRRDVQRLLLRGNKRTAKKVLQFGIDIRGRFPSGKYLLHLFIENKNSDVMDLFDELNIEFDVNARSSDGGTALQEATSKGFFRKVEFLLKHGAQVNSVVSSDTNQSALLLAAIRPISIDPERGIDAAKTVELLLQHGADAQIVLDSIVDFLREDRPAEKVIIAHLAMLGALSESPLTDFTRRRIKSDPSIERYFDSCTQQLEDMKSLEVDGRATLFQLLTGPDGKIVAYARNQEFMLAFGSVIADTPHLESYYSNTLQKRVANSRNVVELEQKAALALKTLTGLCSDAYHNVVSKIFGYLNHQDLQNLSEVGSILLTMK